MNTKPQEHIPHSTPQQKPRVLDLIRQTCNLHLMDTGCNIQSPMDKI